MLIGGTSEYSAKAQPGERGGSRVRTRLGPEDWANEKWKACGKEEKWTRWKVENGSICEVNLGLKFWEDVHSQVAKLETKTHQL